MHFCSSQAIIRHAPNSSAQPRAEAERLLLHQPKPLQAEPHTCKPPKTPASLPGSSPPVSLSTSTRHSKPQNFTFCPFPPAPLSHACFSQVGSSTPCPHAKPQPGPAEANGTAPTDSNESGNLLSGHHDSSACVCLAIAIGQEKLQKSPGASSSLPSQADTSAAPPWLSSFLTIVHVICGNKTG